MGACSRCWRLFEGRLFDNPVYRVEAYSRGRLLERALNRSIKFSNLLFLLPKCNQILPVCKPLPNAHKFLPV